MILDIIDYTNLGNGVSKVNNIQWRRVSENRYGIKTMAFKDVGDLYPSAGEIVGYNGILKGDKVCYKGEIFFVVSVSNIGRVFGLSKTGELPYIVSASPKEVEKYIEFTHQ